MNIERFIQFWNRQVDVILQRVPNREREWWRLRGSDPAMTQRTQRELTIAWQLRRIHDRLVRRFRSAGRIEIRVLLTWTMTLLARDTKRVIRCTIFVRDARV